MVDQFKAHDPRHGARLGQIQGLGRRALFADRGPAGRPGVEGCFVGSPSASSEPAPSAVRLEGRVLAASNVAPLAPRKGGRPGLGEPWKALKISRAAYFRRKAAGEDPIAALMKAEGLTFPDAVERLARER